MQVIFVFTKLFQVTLAVIHNSFPIRTCIKNDQRILPRVSTNQYYENLISKKKWTCQYHAFNDSADNNNGICTRYRHSGPLNPPVQFARRFTKSEHT